MFLSVVVKLSGNSLAFWKLGNKQFQYFNEVTWKFEKCWEALKNLEGLTILHTQISFYLIYGMYYISFGIINLICEYFFKKLVQIYR